MGSLYGVDSGLLRITSCRLVGSYRRIGRGIAVILMLKQIDSYIIIGITNNIH